MMLRQKTSSPIRTITMSHIHDNYDPSNDIGASYQVVIWMVAQPNNISSQPIPSNPAPSVTFTDKQGDNVTGCSYNYRPDLGATIATVPIDLASGLLVITLSVGGTVNGVNGSSVTNGVSGVH